VISKVWAFALIVLTVAPMTAPFPSCDSATLFGHAQPSQTSAHSPSEDKSTATVPVSMVRVLARLSGRIKLLSFTEPVIAPFQKCSATSHTAAPVLRPARDQARLVEILRV